MSNGKILGEGRWLKVKDAGRRRILGEGRRLKAKGRHGQWGRCLIVSAKFIPCYRRCGAVKKNALVNDGRGLDKYE
jgi:hypothetical protein